jgi:outer membrane protein OmpA-like peptidoglycan-associated protein
MLLSRTTRPAVALTLALMIQCSLVAVALAEPVLFSIEGQAALPVTKPQSQLFGPGAVGALAVQYPLTPMFLIGLRAQIGLLTNGDSPATRGLRDPGTGTFELGMLTLRMRPFASGNDVRRATGFFVDLGAGAGVTGELPRGGFEGGLGYGIPMGVVAIAPTLRYLQILQPTSVLSSEDARLLMLGVELTFGDARPAPAAAPLARAAGDADHDGIDDSSDKCPQVPEDLDGHADADGCPDPDNDSDGILDAKDKCPNEAEDFDRYEDADGCPEADNDHDGFADADDQCPNEAEVINGNEDYDGCPDEGLIVFENDRIVLEERVLFDTDRARIRREARPVMKAIVHLMEQHPDWGALRIEGHADARGDAAVNQELSERRAQNVMEELIKLGVPASQIHAVGFGATRLRDKRIEDEAHQRNRRVEFVVESRNATPVPGAHAAAPASEPVAPVPPASDAAGPPDAPASLIEEAPAPPPAAPAKPKPKHPKAPAAKPKPADAASEEAPRP